MPIYRRFNPVKFSGVEWAGLAKETGMKYAVLTAKHCDGFLLWHSRVSDYNNSATPFQREVCDELARAVRQLGLRLGWYFSPMDWRDPDFRTERNAAFLARMQGEVRELLSNYGVVVKAEQSPAAIRITVAQPRQADDTVVKLQVSGSAMDIESIDTPQ